MEREPSDVTVSEPGILYKSMERRRTLISMRKADAEGSQMSVVEYLKGLKRNHPEDVSELKQLLLTNQIAISVKKSMISHIRQELSAYGNIGLSYDPPVEPLSVGETGGEKIQATRVWNELSEMGEVPRLQISISALILIFCLLMFIWQSMSLRKMGFRV